MNGKKTLPLIVIATLLLSLTAQITLVHAAFGFANFLSVSSDVEGSAITSSIKGNVVAAKGSGVPAGTTVSLYWDDVTHAWNGVSGLLNSTTAASDGTFDIWYTVPEAVNGVHNVWFKDYQGNAYGPEGITINTSISLSSTSGLPGDSISAKIYSFADGDKITINFGAGYPAYATTTANSLGTASTSFKVPSGATYGTYHVTAYNTTDALTVEEDFVVGATISVNPISGTVGQMITIQGRGFADGEQVAANAVTIVNTDSSISVPCYITTTTPITVDTTGRIRLNIVIPQVAVTSSDYSIHVTSAAGNANADFEVTALASVSVTPEFGPVASTITVSGVNYPKISGVEVTVYLGGAKVGTVDTLSDGTFSKAFKVPALLEGPYPLVAYTTLAYGVTNELVNTNTFKVGTVNFILSDDSGACGTTISITGNGFGAKEWNATFGSTTIVDNTAVGANGLITGSFQVPQVPVGTYTITAWDTDDSIMITTTFKVTQTTSLTLGVPSAPNGYNVTLRGYGFSDNNVGQAVDFVIYNKTSTGALDTWFTMTAVDLPGGQFSNTNCVTNSSGEFYGYWIVPSSTDLSQGKYWVNATDASTNYAVTVPFTVGPVHTYIAPRKTSFAIGETISFTIQHSFGGQSGSVADGSYVNVANSNGTLVFSGDPIGYKSWVQTGEYYTAPYSAQTAGKNPMVLQDDAPTGTWTYVWHDSTSSHAVIASGSFTVVASAAAMTEQEITALGTQVTALTAQVSSLTTTVGNIATATNAASAAATAASSAATAAATAATAASTAATAASGKADSAITAANAAATAAQGAQSGVSSLTTLVYAAIGASLVAALAAIVALMQISRKIA